MLYYNIQIGDCQYLLIILFAISHNDICYYYYHLWDIFNLMIFLRNDIWLHQMLFCLWQNDMNLSFIFLFNKKYHFLMEISFALANITYPKDKYHCNKKISLNVRLFIAWQGRRDSNTQPTVLETATLPLSHSPIPLYYKRY